MKPTPAYTSLYYLNLHSITHAPVWVMKLVSLVILTDALTRSNFHSILAESFGAENMNVYWYQLELIEVL